MYVALQNEDPSLVNIAKKLFRLPLCWKGQYLAGHARPSYVATHHCALVVSLTHKAAINDTRKYREAEPHIVDNKEAEEEFRQSQEHSRSQERESEDRGRFRSISHSNSHCQWNLKRRMSTPAVSWTLPPQVQTPSLFTTSTILRPHL